MVQSLMIKPKSVLHSGSFPGFTGFKGMREEAEKYALEAISES